MYAFNYISAFRESLYNSKAVLASGQAYLPPKASEAFHKKHTDRRPENR